jgi:predicted O-methyltransferase YrrM
MRTSLDRAQQLYEIALNAPRYLASAGHQDRLRDLANFLRFKVSERLPAVYLAEVWPEIAATRVATTMAISHPYELPYGERAILDAIVRHIRPRTIVEFGTFTGTTTAVLADAAPASTTIHTIDLPHDVLCRLAGVEIAEMVGREIPAAQLESGRIVAHRSDTRAFDYSTLRGRVELAYVDASHEYRDVLHDSKRALEILAPGGVIVWDDYQASEPGVVRALNRVACHIPVVRINHSRLALYRAPYHP